MSFFWALLALVWLAVLYQQNHKRDVAARRRGREALTAIKTELSRNSQQYEAAGSAWSKRNYLTAVHGGALSVVPLELIATLVDVYEPESAGTTRSPEAIAEAIDALSAYLDQGASEL